MMVNLTVGPGWLASQRQRLLQPSPGTLLLNTLKWTVFVELKQNIFFFLCDPETPSVLCLSMLYWYFSFYSYPGILCKLPEAMQSWSHILPKLMVLLQSEGLVKTKGAQGKS